MTHEIPADRWVNPSLLVPGTRVWRYTEKSGKFGLSAEMPCHDEQRIVILLTTAERLAHGGIRQFAICAKCKTPYRLWLELEPPEEDDETAYAALFTVVDDEIAISHKRPPSRRSTA